MTIPKEKCIEGTRDAVNYLGSLGDGLEWTQAAFDKSYKKFDLIGLGKVTKIKFDGIINQMVFKEPKKE